VFSPVGVICLASLSGQDMNLVENAIRLFVLGCNSGLFPGSPAGVYASAGLYSLIETAKANGYKPYGYLGHLFKTLLGCQASGEKESLYMY